MAGVPEALAIPLAGGCIFATITLVVTSEILWRNGVKWDIFQDIKRQTVLNALMFLAGINGIIAYPFNATRSSIWVINITTIFSFVFVQYGLVIVNHNSIERFNAWSSVLSIKTLRFVTGFLYLLPLLALIPVYLAIAEKMPDSRINSSRYNTEIFKPETLALIISTETLATISDVCLLYSIFRKKQKISREGKKNNKYDELSSDLLISYGITWTFLFIDIVVKILIIQGYPFLFDSIISLCTIALRARTNITFGLNLKDIFSADSHLSDVLSNLESKESQLH